MASADDFVNQEEEREQRINFRRFLEDKNMGWIAEDFNIKWGTYTNVALENMFIGWCMNFNAGASPANGRTLGYVKTKLDSQDRPFVTSFSAVPLDGHVPVRLAH